MKCVRLKISGRVQGVAFRYHTRLEAQRLGVSGWVRNVSDGTVEALLEGTDVAVDGLVAWCHKGPAMAEVEDVIQVQESYDGSQDGFEIW
ncbi:MAG: acylphosphatase [Desulfobacterales bacterium]|nr:acylphosphatase [Desulfobacterales bacterium]